MKTYLPRTQALQDAQGIWCVEAAWMDRIEEAYYLGGDFDGRRDCCFYYMVWADADVKVWNVGMNLYGQLEVPFSTTHCTVVGSYRSLRDALGAAEAHAFKRLTTKHPAVSTLTVDDGLLDAPVAHSQTDPGHHAFQ